MMIPWTLVYCVLGALWGAALTSCVWLAAVVNTEWGYIAAPVFLVGLVMNTYAYERGK